MCVSDSASPCRQLELLACLLCCRRLPLHLAIFQLFLYSLPAHKEFRFLLPALQLAIPYCGLGAAWLWQRGKLLPHKQRQSRAWQGCHRLLVILMLFLQLPMTVYLGLYHQRYVLYCTQCALQPRCVFCSTP